MSEKRLLIVFAKNPVKGCVKSRLARTVGNDKALKVYTELLNHTLRVSSALSCDKVIYYSDFIPPDDEWSQSGFTQEIQEGADLGQRMMNAFRKSFRGDYNVVCIIGTDCYEILTTIIEQAFYELKGNEVVIGPAVDGGYYLLGLSAFYEDLFLNKRWSTETVLRDTIETCRKNKLRFELLEELRDIDTEEDLRLSFLSQMVI